MLRTGWVQRCARLKHRAASSAALTRYRYHKSRSFTLTRHTASPVPSKSTSASLAYIPAALSSQKLPFDAVPFPLPERLRTSGLSQHTVYPASATVQQLNLLDICIATGDIVRAKRIFNGLRAVYEAENQLNEAVSSKNPIASTSKRPYAPRRLRLADVVPPSIHTGLLRGVFRQALAHGQGLPANKAFRMRAYVSEAWEWFEMLLNEEHIHGRVDDAAWAIMFKGLVATRLTSPPSRMQDPAAPGLHSISYLYSLAKTHHRSLQHIFDEPIFAHDSLASLNQHSALQVIDELLAVLSKLGIAGAIEDVEGVRQRLIDRMSYADSASKVHAALDETVESSIDQSKTSQVSLPSFEPAAAVLQPARRSEQESVPFQLDSLIGNLNAITRQKSASTDPYVRQDMLEESAYDAARWQALHQSEAFQKIGIATDVRMKSSSLQSYMAKWLSLLEPRLDELLKPSVVPKPKRRKSDPLLTAVQSGDSLDTMSLLKLLETKKLAFITIVETMRMLGESRMSSPASRAARAIVLLGRRIEEEFGAASWKTLFPEIYERAMASKTGGSVAIRQFMKEQGIEAGAVKAAARHGYGDEIAASEAESQGVDTHLRALKEEARLRAMPWTQKMRAEVGGFLLKALFDVATIQRVTWENGKKISEEQPAFYSTFQYFRGKKVGVLKMNEVIAARLDKDSIGPSVFPRYLPMLVPPMPWTAWNKGGYRVHPTDIMRTHDAPEQIAYLRTASSEGHLTSIFAALDALGQTPWRVNRPVFDVVSEVWNSGQTVADIPVDLSKTAIPDAELPADVDLKDPKWRAALKAEQSAIRLQRAKAHSQRCDLNYKLEIARAYLGETFYFPHNIDFRGRAYPIPPNLSHIGNDLSRGLLEFAEGRPLGPNGLRWLRIQIANSAGFDKASFDDREAFAIEQLTEITDCADHPLDGNRWWLKADDPWQCLAACMELTKALRSPDPATFVSHLPIQQDGTCNGLQHYAALGGDATGAAQVNLAKADKPADVYTAVANVVNKQIEADLTSGTASEGNLQAARTLKGKVTRKVVKQTVMTTVYGVTFVGAKRQIERQLRDRGDISADVIYYCASYLADKVLDSIGDLFKGASAIQIWLSVCARLIGKATPLEGFDLQPMTFTQTVPPPDDQIPASDGISPKRKYTRRSTSPGPISLHKVFEEPMASVIWTTPMGLPVAQPYRKERKSQIRTALQSVQISDPNTPTAVDPRAQATAFPPNYIHSLDATHMMLTALECKRRGLAFASVHDSYWTHACDVDELAEALRECFIQLHSQDLLGDLKRDFEARYADFKIRKSPVTEASLRLIRAGQRDVANVRAYADVAPEMAGPSAHMAMNAAAAKHHARDDLAGLAKDLGASSLPPLAVAAQKDTLRQAQRESYASGKVEESTDAEDALFGHSEAACDEFTTAVDEDDEDEDSLSEMQSSLAAVQSFKSGRLVYYNLSDLFPPVPPRGDFDLEKIRESPYFFS